MDVQAFDIERFDSVSLIGGMHVDGHFKCWTSYITTLKHARQASFFLLFRQGFFSAAPFVASIQAEQVHGTLVSCSAKIS